jgi:hypothetical protein
MSVIASGMGQCTFSLVYITQETTCSVHYISDGDFGKQPVRWHERIQLYKQIKTSIFIFVWSVLTLR